MSHISRFSFVPPELAGALFSLPLFSLASAVTITGVTLLASRVRNERRPISEPSEAVARAVRAKYALEHRALAMVAIAVIVFFAAENVIRGYVLALVDVVDWWRFATPVLGAALGIAFVAGVIVFRGTSAPHVPVLLATRRTWTSYSPRADLAEAAVVLLAILVTTIAAGLASSSDDKGRFIYLAIPIPNETIDPIRFWFYGWAYGVPVLVCVAVLIAVSCVALHSNAARPYLRPESVGAERPARNQVAKAVVRISTAGTLLALAGAWRFIAGASDVTGLVVNDNDGGSGSYEVTWRYAEFAALGGWLAPLLEITAFVVLLLVVVRLPTRAREGSWRRADARAVR